MDSILSLKRCWNWLLCCCRCARRRCAFVSRASLAKEFKVSLFLFQLFTPELFAEFLMQCALAWSVTLCSLHSVIKGRSLGTLHVRGTGRRLGTWHVWGVCLSPSTSPLSATIKLTDQPPSEVDQETLTSGKHPVGTGTVAVYVWQLLDWFSCIASYMQLLEFDNKSVYCWHISIVS